jgi:HK97 family phage portal protein
MLVTAKADPTQRPARASRQERSYSDETITPELSLTVSAVLAAFTILSEDISSLPLILYRRMGRNKIRAWDSPYYRLMHDQPNPEMTSMVFREIIVGHLLGWGNFFGQPIFDRRGDVAEVWPLRPDRMTVERKQGQKIYTYQTSEGKPRIFFADEILHIPAFGFDGLIGYSRISLARNAIGLAISTEKFGSKLFSNSANPGVLFKHPGTLGDQAYNRLKESLAERKGTDNSHKDIILEEGMSIEKLSIPPDDAQFLETRKFQVSEIARIFRVPPHMIGDVERTTSWGSGIDSQEQGYVNHTLRPWGVRTEQSLNMQLLLPKDRSTLFYEHLMDGLLRGDIATRYAAYVQAINNGIMSPNEARSRENMNPYKGGDVYWRPLNMTRTEEPVSEPADQQPNDSASKKTSEPGNQASALKPLWRDAVARAMKREQNDVSGAVKRLKKNADIEAFCLWLDNFYNHDHPAFLWKQFQPLLDAQKQLKGGQLHPFILVRISDYCEARRELFLNASVEEVEQALNQASDADEWMNFIEEMTS